MSFLTEVIKLHLNTRRIQECIFINIFFCKEILQLILTILPSGAQLQILHTFIYMNNLADFFK